MPVTVWGGLSIVSLLRNAPTEFTTGGLWSILIVELVFSAILVPVLRARGAKLAAFTLPLETRDALRGVGVLFLCLGAYYTAWYASALLLGSSTMGQIAQIRLNSRAPIPLRITVAAVDPVFEESLFVAYPAVALAARGAPAVVVLSVALRVVVHLYQGPLALVSIAPFGLVSIVYYLRTRRLWPVIASHVMQDVLAFLTLPGS